MAKSAFANIKAEKVVGEPAAAPQPPATRKVKPPQQASRIGKATIVFYDEKSVRKRLKNLANEHERNLQAMMREAVNDLFAKYGLEKPDRPTDRE